MTDPLDALREPTRPVDPDPEFAARLRARLERAVLAAFATREDDMTSTITTTPATTTAAGMRPHSITSYLAVADARAAVEFYVAAFGAVRRDEPIVMPDGRIGHVEVAVGDSVLMLADEYPELGLLAPVTRGGTTQTLQLAVADPDEVVARAVRLGATLERPVSDASYGRTGVVRDLSGHRWMVTRPPAARTGDIAFASLWVPDAVAAAQFYKAVGGLAPDLHGGHDRPTLMVCYAVADLAAAVARVRAAGGTATEPQERPYGLVSDAVDDQGLPFALHQGAAPPRLAFGAVELRHPDTTLARAFYGTVLGWGFEPAGPDAWHAAGPNPPVRLVPSTADPVAVPVFTVDDLDAAATAIQRAGGSCTPADPGTAACADPQGTAFTIRA